MIKHYNINSLREFGTSKKRGVLGKNSRFDNMISKILLFSFLLLSLLTLGIVLERSYLPETTDRMQTRALEFGHKRGNDVPPQPFHFDGCTLFPDSLPGADYEEACLDHDIAYWYGGAKEERLEADTVFWQDVVRSGPVGYVLQFPMYWAVRSFGDSLVAEYFDAQWGFGYRKE